MGRSLPGSSIHGIFQARVLKWVAISYSRGSSRPRDRTQVSHIVGKCFTVWAKKAPFLILLSNFIAYLSRMFSVESSDSLCMVCWAGKCPSRRKQRLIGLMWGLASWGQCWPQPQLPAVGRVPGPHVCSQSTHAAFQPTYTIRLSFN